MAKIVNFVQNVFDEGEMEKQLKNMLHAERLKYLPWFTIIMSLTQLFICVYHSVEFPIGRGEKNNIKNIITVCGTSAGVCERQLDQGGRV